MNPAVDNYFIEGCMRCPLGATPDCKVHKWTRELKKLREVLNDCGLVVELKWSMPTYTVNGKNVLILAAYKDFASIDFFKGVLLKDEKNSLKAPGKNSQSSRRLTFTNIDDIIANEETIRHYVLEAAELEKAGAKVEFKKEPEPIPQALLDRFKVDNAYKEAFEALTPGRQRGYILHFAQPKSEAAKLRRIEKMKPLILQGKGWNGR